MDDATKLYLKIQELVKNEARQVATEVFNTLGTQYDVGKIPADPHNGIASSKVPIASIVESIPITGNNTAGICSTSGFTSEADCILAGGVWTQGGVLNPAVLDTQKVNNQYDSGIPNPNTVYILPINVIYGFGPGVHSEFNGGAALPGTMIFFENADASGLWVMTENGWRGVHFDLTV